MNTHWTSPKKNFLAGMNDLRHCLASGYNARLIRARNEDCAHPLTVKNRYSDFRCYEFAYGTLSTKNEILASTTMDDFEKELSLNYKACFGTEEAMNRYYETGVLSNDNFKGMGRSHLVKVSDMVEFFEKNNFESGGDMERAKMFKEQYITGEQANNRHFWDFFRLKNGYNHWNVIHFKHKLWVVEMLDKNEPKAKLPVTARIVIGIINVLTYPLKFIPRKSVLKMDEYTDYTFRIGSVRKGFSVQFQIPKKFSFKD
jgi:hypothetical protein